MTALHDDALLSATGIEVAYGAAAKVKVLHGVDIAVRRGETVGIVGESGSGKTTLGRALLRLVDVSAGTIRFDGQDITHLPDSVVRPLRRRMQIIFQDPMASLNPRHQIHRILAEPLRLHGLARDEADIQRRIASVLDRMSLPSACLRRYPHELSGGQRQRVGIARAVLLEPEFVLADEIVSGLDVSTQAQALNLLKELSAELGLAMAFISHDLSVISSVCDRVYVMRHGRIVEQGLCKDVFSTPSHDYTRELIAAIPLPAPISGWLDPSPRP